MSKLEEPKMGRIKINFESLTARFPLGTLDRIEIVLTKYESKADFIRDAVLTRLKMREGRRRRDVGLEDTDAELPADYFDDDPDAPAAP
jgi:hypothetical protein